MDPSRMQTRVLASLSSPPSSSPPLARLPCILAPPSTQPPRLQTQATPNFMPSIGPFSHGGNLAGGFVGQLATSGTGLFQMDCMRELYTTRERIKQLEIENVKLMVERDTLRDVLNQKQTVIRDPVPSVPTRVTQANIKFWTLEDFEKWLLTPEAQVANRGKEPFLEEENGDLVSDQRVSDIKACMRSAFCELVNMKRAPQVWGGLDTTGRQTFHSLVEKSYPLFRCAENGWKLDRLARATYPAWRRFHLDENMDWKSRDEKKKPCLKRKNTGEESPGPTKLQRSDPEFNNVAHRGGDAPSAPPSGSLSTSSLAPTTSAGSKSMTWRPGVVLPSEPGPSVKGDPDTQQELNLALSAYDSNEALSTTKHVNPLVENIPPEMKNFHATSSQILASSSQPSKKITKMRPSPTRNGRNLCAHRWLKAFKKTTNGTTSEFKQYYRSLSKEQRESYDREAADLVARNAWNKQAYNGIMY